MDADVPLVVPEVNPDRLGLIDQQRDRGSDGFIVTNPNCSTIILIMCACPRCRRASAFTDVRVATMQAISGAGFSGVPRWRSNDNVIPYIGKEEEKMESEALKSWVRSTGELVSRLPSRVSADCPPCSGHRRAHNGSLGRHRRIP